MVVPHPVMEGLTVLERGWLSSNNILLHGQGAGAVLVDSGHVVHAGQTVQLLLHALGGEPLRCVLNTHLHSDHCGGNAELHRRFGAVAFVPPGSWDAVRAWDEDALSYRATRQRCERFDAHGTITPGEAVTVGHRTWHVVAAPGHDPHSVMLFDDRHGVLISADALWENGFGVVFPELAGEDGFDDVADVLDTIERLDARWVIPGHGSPFTDVPGALQRARARLAAFQADPARHARHAAKVLVKYHLLEEQRQSIARFHLWAGETPYLRATWERLDRPDASLHAWCDRLLAELSAVGAVRVADGWVDNV